MFVKIWVEERPDKIGRRWLKGLSVDEPFPALVMAFAVLVVIFDLWADSDWRERMATEHRAWWERLRSTTFSRLMSDAAAGFYGFPAFGTAVGRSRFRQLT